ncbi:MAG: NusG domain II-containing protein [Clostridia bacterium]|nr:NusG domain II-containing protein [Clostridia bacterium]
MTRLDKLIFCVLIVSSVLSILFTNIIFAKKTADEVIVEVNGEEYGRYPLYEKNVKILDVKTEFGYNKIEILNGKVRVSDTNCPDRLEVKSGIIDSAGEMLVCLPNRVVVRISGEKDVDRVAY